MSRRGVLLERLRRETGEARRRRAEVEAGLEDRGDEPPNPGDLYVLTETAELPVEWAVLEQDPQGRWLAVPVDSNSLVGSADVVAPEGQRGPLTLRCRFGVRLSADTFDPKLRTGALAPEVVAEARQTWHDLEAGHPTGLIVARDVDADPEYQDWVEEVLEKAREAFPESSPAAGGETQTAETGKLLRFPERWFSKSFRDPWAIAAALFLVTTFGLGGEAWRAGSKHRKIVADHHQELAELEQEHQRSEDQYRRSLVEAERQKTDAQQKEGNLRRLIDELKATVRIPRSFVNSPVAFLTEGSLRGGETETLPVPSGADLVILFVVLDDPEPYSRYRLEVRQKAGGREIWSSDELEANETFELLAALPAGLLPPGSYRIQVSGIRDGGAQELKEYTLTITSK